MTLDEFIGTNIIFFDKSFGKSNITINFTPINNIDWIDAFPIIVDWERFILFSYNGEGLSKCRLRDSMKIYHSKKRETPSKFIARMQGT